MRLSGRKETGAELLEVEKYLDKLDNPEIRNILRLRYEQGLSWMEVAMNMQFNRKSSTKREQKDFLKIYKCRTCRIFIVIWYQKE